MEEDDGLYDFLPEMCDMSSCVVEDVTNSLSADEKSILRLPFCTKQLSDNSGDREVSQRFLNKCICHDSVQWGWESNDECSYVKLENNNLDVRFHQNHSSGTAVVRGSEPMCGHQYYWEVKITQPVYGTDVMLGIGTPDAPVRDMEHQFISALGCDDKTWGFSYRGLFQHNGLSQTYAQSFCRGDIIGVHLDLWQGTLSFYKNRKNLGIATSGLRGKTLYAMASSTAAFSGMRIIRSSSFPSSLQFLCCFKLRECIPGNKNVLDVLNLPPGLKYYLKRKLSWLLGERSFDGSDVCSFDHDKSIEGIADDSGFTSVLHTLVNENGSCRLADSVLFRNFNRFQGRGSTRSGEDSGSSSQNSAKKSKITSYKDPGSDSD